MQCPGDAKPQGLSNLLFRWKEGLSVHEEPFSPRLSDTLSGQASLLNPARIPEA